MLQKRYIGQAASPGTMHSRTVCSRLRYFFVATGLTIIAYTFNIRSFYVPVQEPSKSPPSRPPESYPLRPTATNATLGFQKIFALSREDGWRTKGLLAAALYSELDIEIPAQQQHPDMFIEEFQKLGPEDGTRPSRGSAEAWIAHMDLIKYAISLGLETFLILEDDADWDLSIKSQMDLLSNAVRVFQGTGDPHFMPYGQSWDVLWIGHCGETTSDEITRYEYPDPTRFPTQNYTGWSKQLLSVIEPDSRALQNVCQPVCSFGYAMTREGAQKSLNWVERGNDEAFDIKLARGCKFKELDCITVNPEIMHHYMPPTEAGSTSLVKGKDGEGEGGGAVSSSKLNEISENVKGGTENIVQSARCRALFDDRCVKTVWGG